MLTARKHRLNKIQTRYFHYDTIRTQGKVETQKPPTNRLAREGVPNH